MTPTILVTGAAGFVGSHLLDLLTDRSVHPRAARLVAWHRPGHTPDERHPDTEWMAVDLLDRSAVTDAVATIRPSVVYHAGGAAHVVHAWNDTEATFAVNVHGTHYLLQALAQAGTTTRVLIPSSGLVYRPASEPLTEDDALVPGTPYGLSKLAQEMTAVHAMTSSLTVLIARAFTHVGARQSVEFSISSFARQIAAIEAGRQSPEILVGNLDAKRDLTDVRDTVRAYLAVAERGKPGRPYNICSGVGRSIGSVLQLLTARARTSISIRVDSTRLRTSDASVLVGDRSRAARELAWEPTIPLDQTVDAVLDYWRHQTPR